MSVPSPDPSQTTPQSPLQPVRYFLLGAVLSGIPVLTALWFSLDMTDVSWQALDAWQLAVAIAVPVLCGVLSVSFGDRAIAVLSRFLDSLQLPY